MGPSISTRYYILFTSRSFFRSLSLANPVWKISALKPTHPLPVNHSWPLYERARFFELGQLHRCETLDPIPDVVDVAARLAPARAPIGQWECDLTDNKIGRAHV